jgi:transmembrane sensor
MFVQINKDMFRHSDSIRQQDRHNDFLSEDKINNSIRYFKVPAVKSKSDVLDSLLREIDELKIVQPVKNKVRSLYISIGSFASAACLLLFIWYFAFSVETYNGLQGQNNVFYLPDHSKVTLNENSQVKFSKRFFDRNVSLQGEAYFEVEKGSKFTVKSQNGEVSVLGTKFRVSDSVNGFIVSCYEGKVAVKYKKDERLLLAGNQCVGEGNSIQVTKIEDPASKDKVIKVFHHTFMNVNVSEVWPVIEKHFGVTISTNMPQNKKFTGSFHTTNLQEVIEIICTSLDLNYEQVNDSEFVVKSDKKKI